MSLRKTLLISLTLAIPALAAPQRVAIVKAEDVKLPAKENFQLFLLAGQSNMAGRGKLDDAAKKPIPNVFALNQELAWQPAVDPLHWDKKTAGVGIGKTFAEIIAEKNPEDCIGLIPAACGGSSITSWVPGGFHDQTKSNPYDDAIKRAKLAMEKGSLKAILWHQGESDSRPKNAEAYEQRLTELIERFRKDLETPDLPVIIGQLSSFPGEVKPKGRLTVDKAQQAVAQKMKNVAFVTSENFTSDDGIHFDTKSVRIFAERYAEAYISLVGK